MEKILLLLMFSTFVVLFLSQIYSYNQTKKSVKAIVITPTMQMPILTPTLTLTPPSITLRTSMPTSTPTPTPFTILKKASYTIAIFGDSMVDTMGEELEYLQKTLTNKYPQNKFNLYNYGIGGQNVEQGLARFESTFVNRERQYPPIPALAPDILIIGSFAYNPFSIHDRNRHYSLLRELVAKAKNVSSNVYLLAEIAPLKIGFGKGKNGVNMPENDAFQHASHIVEQLDDVINLSTAENIPLINVYYKSRLDGSFGDPYFVNKDDGIHPSVAGHYLTAESIGERITFD